MTAIYWKELQDHFSGRRFVILLGLVVFSAMWASFVAVRTIRGVTGNVPSDLIFLQLFTSSSGTLPPFLFFLSFFSPLVSITLGFDAINSERSQGTLSRLLSQPVHRDAVFNGKFLAALTTIAVIEVGTVVMVVGLGMFILGFPPTSAAILRIALFTIAIVVYMGFWLALAMLFSVWFNRAVTSALSTLALWLFFGFVVLMLAGSLADVFVSNTSTAQGVIDHARVEQDIRRASPVTLFQEASDALLTPTERALGPILSTQVQGLNQLKPLPVSQSLLLIWPHLVAILALAGVCFGLSYVRFLREEIRS